MPRRPQINFQVEDAMKRLYEEAKLQGHWVTRLCAAGLLMMIEDPAARVKALQRLRDWEADYSDADDRQIRDFVEGAAGALQSHAPDTRRGRPARGGRKGAKAPGS